MTFFCRACLTKMKNLLTPALMAALLLFPLATVCVSALFDRGSAGIHVGLYYEPGVVAERVAAQFAAGLQNNAALEIYEDEELMKKNVAKHFLECGYKINPGIETGDYDEVVTIYKSPATMSDQVISLALTGALTEVMAGELGYGVLKKHLPGLDRDEMIRAIQRGADDYLRDGDLMHIQIVETGDAPAQREASPLRGVVHGLMALFALLLGLIGAGVQMGERETPVGRRLLAAGISDRLLRCADVFVLFLTLILFFGICFAAMVFLPGCLYAPLTELCMALPYGLAVALLATALRGLSGSGLFPGLTSALFVTTGLLGGVFFDAREIVPALAAAQMLFPSRYYMLGLGDPSPVSGVRGLCVWIVILIPIALSTTSQIPARLRWLRQRRSAR